MLPAHSSKKRNNESEYEFESKLEDQNGEGDEDHETVKSLLHKNQKKIKVSGNRNGNDNGHGNGMVYKNGTVYDHIQLYCLNKQELKNYLLYMVIFRVRPWFDLIPIIVEYAMDPSPLCIQCLQRMHAVAKLCNQCGIFEQLERIQICTDYKSTNRRIFQKLMNTNTTHPKGRKSSLSLLWESSENFILKKKRFLFADDMINIYKTIVDTENISSLQQNSWIDTILNSFFQEYNKQSPNYLMLAKTYCLLSHLIQFRLKKLFQLKLLGSLSQDDLNQICSKITHNLELYVTIHNLKSDILWIAFQKTINVDWDEHHINSCTSDLVWIITIHLSFACLLFTSREDHELYTLGLPNHFKRLINFNGYKRIENDQMSSDQLQSMFDGGVNGIYAHRMPEVLKNFICVNDNMN
jgi:hypothetical protein